MLFFFATIQRLFKCGSPEHKDDTFPLSPMDWEWFQMLHNALLKQLLYYAAIFYKGYYVTHKYSQAFLALQLQVMQCNLTK